MKTEERIAIEQLEKFLKDNPQLLPMQKKIDKILNNLPEEARLGMICYLLADSLEELHIELTLLEQLINE